jgi:hypothetical protein
MSHSRIWISVLLLALVASNAVWASLTLRGEAPVIEGSYGCTETEQYLEILQNTVFPIAAAVNVAAKPGMSKSAIVAATQHDHLFANQTCVISSDTRVADRFGLRFENDRLVAVSTTLCLP